MRYALRRSGTARYPEQGERQALRGARRAQGGPGIEKDARGHWVARSA